MLGLLQMDGPIHLAHTRPYDQSLTMALWSHISELVDLIACLFAKIGTGVFELNSCLFCHSSWLYNEYIVYPCYYGCGYSYIPIVDDNRSCLGFFVVMHSFAYFQTSVCRPLQLLSGLKMTK